MSDITDAEAPDAIADPEAPEEGAEEEASKEPTPDELLARDDIKSRVDELIREAAEKAESRGRNRAVAEARRNFARPEAVQAALLQIAQEGFKSGEVTQSMRDRANTLLAQHSGALADQYSAEVHEVLFEKFKGDIPQDALDAYYEKRSEQDVLGAYQALIDGAVRSQLTKKASESEKAFEARVEERVKAELAQLGEGEGNGSAPPPAPRGSRGRGPVAFTSAELLSPTIRAELDKLPREKRQELYARVNDADERFGAETVRDDARERVRSLISA